MMCPKCNGSMRTVTVDDYEVDRCDRCEGLWFDLREQEHLKDAAGSECVDTGAEQPDDAMNAVRDIDCPRCNVKMIKLSMVDQTHIKYEQCHLCGGVYFDAGEFTDFKFKTLAEKVKRVVKPF